MKSLIIILILLPLAAMSQHRQWQATTDSTGQKIYRWSDTGDRFTETELRTLRDSDPALGIQFPQDRIADNLMGAGISFGLAIVSPILVGSVGVDGITLDQLASRQKVQIGLAAGFSALGIFFTLRTADHLRAWQPIASPHGVGIGITLK